MWEQKQKKEKRIKKVKNILKIKKWLHLIIKHNKKEEEIICTPNHRFYIEEKGWTEAFKILSIITTILSNSGDFL